MGYPEARQPLICLLANHLKINIIQTNLLPDDLLKRGVIAGGGSKWGTLKQDNPYCLKINVIQTNLFPDGVLKRGYYPWWGMNGGP